MKAEQSIRSQFIRGAVKYAERSGLDATRAVENYVSLQGLRRAFYATLTAEQKQELVRDGAGRISNR